MLMNVFIHRRARGHMTLCGNVAPIELLTTDDEQTTCPICLSRLFELLKTDTKTEFLKKIKVIECGETESTSGECNMNETDHQQERN